MRYFLFTCFAMWTTAVVVPDHINTCAAIIAGVMLTIIDIFFASLAGPAVDTHTHERALKVSTGTAIFTNRRILVTFVHVLRTEPT